MLKARCTIISTSSNTRCKLPAKHGKRCHVHGKGLFSTFQNIKNRVVNTLKGPRSDAPPVFKNFLSKEGNVKIKNIDIARKPILSGVESLLNGLSLGNFANIKRKLGYDNVYHNYLIVELDNGKRYKLEKNHVLEAKALQDDDLKHERYSIPVKKDINLNSLIDNASKGDNDFYKYNARNNNCQVFTKEVIERNGLTPVDNSAKEILNPQDGEKLIDSLGKLNFIPKLVTDIAGASDRLINGGKIRHLTVDQVFAIANR